MALACSRRLAVLRHPLSEGAHRTQQRANISLHQRGQGQLHRLRGLAKRLDIRLESANVLRKGARELYLSQQLRALARGKSGLTGRRTSASRDRCCSAVLDLHNHRSKDISRRHSSSRSRRRPEDAMRWQRSNVGRDDGREGPSSANAVKPINYAGPEKLHSPIREFLRLRRGTANLAQELLMTLLRIGGLRHVARPPGALGMRRSSASTSARINDANVRRAHVLHQSAQIAREFVRRLV